MKKIILLLVGVLVVIALPAQTYHTRKTTNEKARKYYDEGRNDARWGQWSKALQNFQRALKEDPRFLSAEVMMASVHYSMGNTAKAKQAYENVLVKDPEFEPDVYYMLGTICWKLDSFEQAASRFRQFIDREQTNEEMLRKARRYEANSVFSAKAVKNPVPFKPVRLSDSINTPASEYLPMATADGERLIFTRYKDLDENFFLSEKIGGVWRQATPIASINSMWNEGGQAISADGRYFIFTGCNREGGMGSCDLYYTEELKRNQWSPPVNLRGPVNSRAWESQPSLSSDGRTLLFTSERAGGLGGRDLWLSYRQPDGTWANPENLGPKINTPDHEQSPYLHPDGQTLYFMSKGRPGLGGYDLYVSRRQADGTWGEPHNLGFPINTKAHEGALFVSLDGKTAYFSSDRKDFGTLATDDDEPTVFENPTAARKTSDIFAFELYPEVRPAPVTYARATVRDRDSKLPLRARAEVLDLATGTVLFTDSTLADGSVLVCLPMGKNYGLSISREGYLFHSEHFSLREMNTLAQPFLLDVSLEKIGTPAPVSAGTVPKTSEPVVLRNIFFETGSARLLPESLSELARLKSLLVQYPTLRIRIQGHTDNVGSDFDNQLLSTQRAKAVYDYLLAEGVFAERLSYEGYGEVRPIDTNDTPEGRQRNRRTEFVVVY